MNSYTNNEINTNTGLNENQNIIIQRKSLKYLSKTITFTHAKKKIKFTHTKTK